MKKILFLFLIICLCFCGVQAAFAVDLVINKDCSDVNNILSLKDGICSVTISQGYERVVVMDEQPAWQRLDILADNSVKIGKIDFISTNASYQVVIDSQNAGTLTFDSALDLGSKALKFGNVKVNFGTTTTPIDGYAIKTTGIISGSPANITAVTKSAYGLADPSAKIKFASSLMAEKNVDPATDTKNTLVSPVPENPQTATLIPLTANNGYDVTIEYISASILGILDAVSADVTYDPAFDPAAPKAGVYDVNVPLKLDETNFASMTYFDENGTPQTGKEVVVTIPAGYNVYNQWKVTYLWNSREASWTEPAISNDYIYANANDVVTIFGPVSEILPGQFYTFAGWEENSSGKVNYPVASLPLAKKLTGDLTLTGIWNPNTLTIPDICAGTSDDPYSLQGDTCVLVLDKDYDTIMVKAPSGWKHLNVVYNGDRVINTLTLSGAKTFDIALTPGTDDDTLTFTNSVNLLNKELMFNGGNIVSEAGIAGNPAFTNGKLSGTPESIETKGDLNDGSAILTVENAMLSVGNAGASKLYPFVLKPQKEEQSVADGFDTSVLTANPDIKSITASYSESPAPENAKIVLGPGTYDVTLTITPKDGVTLTSYDANGKTVSSTAPNPLTITFPQGYVVLPNTTPTVEPTGTETVTPTTPVPTGTVTPVTPVPTGLPTAIPTFAPTTVPTAIPTVVPTGRPTQKPQPFPWGGFIIFDELFDGPEGPCCMPGTGFPTTSIRADIASANLPGIGYELQIPVLDVNTVIVSIPRDGNSWDVSGLGKEAGLLEDSPLPGEGPAVIAGHNHLDMYETGPFLFLGTLEEGDSIFVRTPEGELQRYAVYANKQLLPDDIDTLTQTAGLYENSLTLLTCEDETPDGSYLYRRVVFAQPL